MSDIVNLMTSVARSVTAMDNLLKKSIETHPIFEKPILAEDVVVSVDNIPLELTPEETEQIEAIWTETNLKRIQAGKGERYNGTVYSVSEIGLDDQGKLLVSLQEIQYKTLLGLRKIRSENPPKNGFTTGLTVTSDGYVVFGTKAKASRMGMTDVPGGILEKTADQEIQSGIDIFNHHEGEIVGELGLDEEVSLHTQCIGIADNKFSTGVVFLTNLNVSSQEVQSMFDQGTQEAEFSQLQFVPIDQLYAHFKNKAEFAYLQFLMPFVGKIQA